MAEKAKHPVQTLERTLAIIEVLQTYDSAKLAELAQDLEMSKSAIHNHLSTLREHGYVIQKEDKYELGMRFLNVGGGIRNKSELYQEAKPKVKQLAVETNELASLATKEREHAIVLYRAKGNEAVDLDTHVGSRITLHNSALGKAILAHLPREEVEELIDEHGLPRETPNTITSRDELHEELAQIREQGYAFDNEERLQDLQGIAAPLLMNDGSVKGAISIGVPKTRLKKGSLFEEYVEEVQNSSNTIELSLRYS